jgi:hypothetical protein
MKDKRIKFAKYPSCFGKLDCKGIMEVALKHGMEVIACRKPDMHVHNEVGLYGTRKQMKTVEAEWTANGNTPKPRSFSAVFGVDLNIPKRQWVSVKIAASKKNAIPVTDGWDCDLQHVGKQVKAPKGYRPLRSDELPEASDIAYDLTLELWTPIDSDKFEYYGLQRIKEVSYAILRKESK